MDRVTNDGVQEEKSEGSLLQNKKPHGTIRKIFKIDYRRVYKERTKKENYILNTLIK